MMIALHCSLCGAEYAPGEITYTCPRDGGNLDVVIDIDFIRTRYRPADILFSRVPSLWRYLPLLPVAEPAGKDTPLWAVGRTPTFAVPRLAARLGLRNVWVKDESRNPTASFKDRASALVVVRSRQENPASPRPIVTASTGNAGAALAGMAAALGHPAVIFAPRTAPPAKIAQLLVFGAHVVLVDGNYDQAFDLSIAAAHEFGWYCRNTGYNPFTLEGKKTAAFEIWEWWVGLRRLPGETLAGPLAVFVSVGDGNIISGIHKGFADLQALGWFETMPRLFGVQAEGSAAIARAWAAGTETITPVSARTLADSISVDLPRDGVRAVRAATQTGGAYLTVSDEQILAGIAALGREGIFAEPAGAAAFAGLAAAVAQGLLLPETPVLVVNTGSGLKDVGAAARSVSAAPIIEPTLAAVKQLLPKGVSLNG